MERSRFRAVYMLILIWCTGASRIFPKGLGSSNKVAGSPHSALPSEEGDTMMLLQGVRGVNVQHGSAESHGSMARKHSTGTACTGDCEKQKQKEGRDKDSELKAAAQTPISVGTLAEAEASSVSQARSQALRDYITAIEIHVHRHLRLATGPTIFAVLFALIIVVCFFIVLVRSGVWYKSSESEPVVRHRFEASPDRPRTPPQASSPFPGPTRASPVVSTRDFQRVSLAAMTSPNTTSASLQPQAPAQDDSLARKQMAAEAQVTRFAPPAVVAVPPLCPKMSMPACEARFLIPKHAISMVADGGALKIVGLSGSALFQATVRTVKGYRLLEMSLCTDLSTPCATIRLDHPEAPSGAVIRGEGGAYYGILEMRSDGSCEVTRDDRTLMFIEADTDTLTLSLKAPRGQILATVSCLEHVDIKVSQGNDVVLLISCILAVLIQSAPPNF
mmetsp:Transcript_64590/g.122504  ORF Transcript_64590/g.122504 Transcript_64590/m.122504 type:complete len:446 (-) Transcript_64590:474-1811(-)